MSLAILLPASLVTISLTSLLYYFIPSSTPHPSSHLVPIIAKDIVDFDRSKLKSISRSPRDNVGTGDHDKLMNALMQKITKNRSVIEPIM